MGRTQPRFGGTRPYAGPAIGVLALTVNALIAWWASAHPAASDLCGDGADLLVAVAALSVLASGAGAVDHVRTKKTPWWIGTLVVLGAVFMATFVAAATWFTASLSACFVF